MLRITGLDGTRAGNQRRIWIRSGCGPTQCIDGGAELDGIYLNWFHQLNCTPSDFEAAVDLVQQGHPTEQVMPLLDPVIPRNRYPTGAHA